MKRITPVLAVLTLPGCAFSTGASNHQSRQTTPPTILSLPVVHDAAPSPTDPPTTVPSPPTTPVPVPTTVPSYTPESTTPPTYESTDSAWSRVEACESHGIPADGPTYYGVLGMTQAAWIQGGGLQFAPTAYTATFDEQAQVASIVNHGYVPDADGCHGW